jgi:hypothetical protein
MSLEDECIRIPDVAPIAGTTSLTSAVVGSTVRRFADASIDNTIITYRRTSNRTVSCHGSRKNPPKKRKTSEEGDGSEESEWEQVGVEDNDVQDSALTSQASGKDDSVSGGNESQEKKMPKRSRKLRRKFDEDEHSEGDDVVDFKTSQERLTEKGGYAHTRKSRLKISRALRGTTPWNKGKNRSVDEREKISAGVRATNRAILLEKLKRLGMTEDEWFAKKRKEKSYVNAYAEPR